MNIYFIIILTTIVGIYLLETFLEVINIKSLSPKLPKEFADVYDKKEYKRSQEYAKTNTKFGLFASTFDIVLFLAFWLLGGFEWLDVFVRGFGYSTIPSGLLFVFFLYIAKLLIGIPFSLYSTFVIEEKYGFNKTKPKTYVFDIIKSFVLTMIIGGGLLFVIFWFFEKFPVYGWLYVFIAVMCIQFFLIYITPTWILPLFNKYLPLKKGELRDAIFAYAKKEKFPLKEIYTMDGSKRSTKSNAFFIGFGNNKRIVLFDTLIKQHAVPELVSVIAHEVGHYKRHHQLQKIALSILHMFILFFLLSFFLGSKELSEAFYITQPAIYTSFLFFFLLYTPISFVLGIFLNIHSRMNEYQADAYSIQTTKDPKAFMQALKKLSVHNLSNVTPHPLYVFFHFSHPTVLQRIDAINKL